MSVYHFKRDGVMHEMHTLSARSYGELIRRHAGQPTRFSWLKHLARSPHDYLRAVLDGTEESFALKLGKAPGHDRSTAMRIGTAVHHYMLGSAERVDVFDGPRRGPKWLEFSEHAEAHDHVVLNPREHAYASGMVARLRECDRACQLLFDGTEVERRLDWELRGRAIRSTPDAFALAPTSRVVDLKTTRDSSPAFMSRAVFSMSYHAQLECYAQAIQAVFGARPEQAWIVAIDDKNPPCCYEIEPSALKAGARLISAWAENLSVCEASGHFPYPEVLRIALPEHLDDSADMLELPPEEEEA